MTLLKHQQNLHANRLMKTKAALLFLILSFSSIIITAASFYSELLQAVADPFREAVLDPALKTTIHPDAFRDFPQLVRSRGFGAEVHTVTTNDGYILTMHRVINPSVTKDERKLLKPVIIQHGLLCSSDDFVINSLDSIRPERPPGLDNIANGGQRQLQKEQSNHVRRTSRVKAERNNNNNDSISENRIQFDGRNSDSQEYPNSLAYLLVNRGYDVWLPNTRGNTYSKQHVNLTEHDPAFWNFSLDEMVKYDLPAVIDYVKKKTKKQKLAYVGHSQGTAMMFGFLASMPKRYTDIIEPFIALAPVAYLKNVITPVKYLNYYRAITELFMAPVADMSPAQKILAPFVCIGSSAQSELCKNVVFMAAGFNQQQYDSDRIPVFVRHVPAGTSWKVLNHYGQMYESGIFRMYDYGVVGNQQKYGKTSSPEYDLSRIKTRSMSFMRCANDWFGSPRDVVRLKSELTVPLYDDYEIKDPNWSHIDFMYAKQVGQVVNRRVLRILDYFTDNSTETSKRLRPAEG